MPTVSKYYTPLKRFVTSTGDTLHPGYPLRYCGQMVDRVQLCDDDGHYYHISLVEFDEYLELLPAARYRAFKRGQRFVQRTGEALFRRPVRFAKRIGKSFLKKLDDIFEGIVEGISDLFD